jgi:hypothetical protein
MSHRPRGTRCPARVGSGSASEEMGRQDICPGLGRLPPSGANARARSAEKLSSRELGGTSPEDTWRHPGRVGQAPALAAGLRHLPRAFGIWGEASAHGDGLRHLPEGFGICRTPFGGSALAEWLWRLPAPFGICQRPSAFAGAVWRFGICRWPFGGSANAEVSFGAWTFVRGGFWPGQMSAAVSRLDICPQRLRGRTFVRTVFGLGQMSASVSRPDKCPRPFRGRTFVRPCPGRLPWRASGCACLVRGRSGQALLQVLFNMTLVESGQGGQGKSTTPSYMHYLNCKTTYTMELCKCPDHPD